MSASIEVILRDAGKAAHSTFGTEDSLFTSGAPGPSVRIQRLVELPRRLPPEMKNLNGLRDMTRSLVCYALCQDWDKLRSCSKRIRNWCGARIGEIIVEDAFE